MKLWIVRRAVVRAVVLSTPLLFVASSRALSEPLNAVDMRTYSMIGAMNICVLDALDVDFDKALLAYAVAVTRVVQDKSNTRFEGDEGAAQLWTDEDHLRQEVASKVAMLVSYYCKDKLGTKNSQKLNRVLKEIDKSRPQGSSQALTSGRT